MGKYLRSIGGKVKADEKYAQYDPIHIKMFLRNFIKCEQFYDVCLQSKQKCLLGF